MYKTIKSDLSKLFGISLIALGISACSGGGGNGSSTPVVTPSDPDPDPVSDIAEPLFPVVAENTSCDGLDYLNAISVESDSAVVESFTADKIIDNSLAGENRWETTESAAVATLELGYRHQIKEIGTAWYNGDQDISSFDIAVSEDGIDYSTILNAESSSGNTLMFDRFDIEDSVARFVRITSYGNANDSTTALAELAIFGCPLDVDAAPIETQTVDLAQFNLDPNAPPGDNFDLLTWALDTPRTDPDDGFSLRASERELDEGFEDADYFYTADDGGMVFVATIFGAKTSANTSFTRSELREMLRRGNTGVSTQGVNQNNWILGYQPEVDRNVGGRGGLLKATLKVDEVTTTGTVAHQGRVVIGQIHADNDEPIRLYFKKFPNNDRGYVYFAHEIRDSDDIYRVVLGEVHTNEDNAPYYSVDPEQGIALGEIFSYEIDQSGSRIDVILRRGDLTGPIIGHNYVDMELLNSAYDIPEEWMYFKAGAYSQNNTGNSGDAEGVGSEFDKVTFYYLSNTHGEQ